MVTQAVNEGIKVGHSNDLRVIEFYRTPLGGKDVDYRLMRQDGTVISAHLSEGHGINAEGLTLSYLGKLVRH
jgi:hypothetical protein